MTNLEMWNLIVGFFSPILIGVIQQPHWNKGLRAFVMLAFCLVAAFVTLYFNNMMHLDDVNHIITSILLTVVTAIASYKGFWQPTGIVPAVETSTSGQRTS